MFRVGYLSGAPRVSTSLEAKTSGPRAHILGVIKAFQQLGWRVEAFIVGDRLPIKVNAANNSNNIPRSWFVLFFFDITRIAMSIVNSRKAFKELGHKVDIVYERFAVLQCLGWIFKRNSIPWILETNGPFYYEAKAERKSLVLSGIAKWLEIKAFERCDVLVCVSEPLKKIIVRELGLSKQLERKIIVIPNAVDIRYLDPGEFTPRRVYNGFTIGFVGSLIKWQALDLLIEALYELQIDKDLRMNLVIVGDGPMRQEWETLSEKLGMDSQIHFAGHVDYSEIPRYIAGFDIGYSGQIPLGIGDMYMSPLKLYEYMAMEKPVLASAYDDAKSLIQEQKTGFLYEPTDIEDLKRALGECYKQREELIQMGKLARSTVVKHHSWEIRVQNLIEEAKKVLEESYGFENGQVIRY